MNSGPMVSAKKPGSTYLRTTPAEGACVNFPLGCSAAMRHRLPPLTAEATLALDVIDIDVKKRHANLRKHGVGLDLTLSTSTRILIRFATDESFVSLQHLFECPITDCVVLSHCGAEFHSIAFWAMQMAHLDPNCSRLARFTG